MYPETISEGSAESDGSPVNLLSFNLEFHDQEFIENITTTDLLKNIKCREYKIYVLGQTRALGRICPQI